MEVIVEVGLERERAHDAGHAEQLRAHGEAGDGGGEPQQRLMARKRRSQPDNRIPPVPP